MSLGAKIASRRQADRHCISVAEWGDEDAPLQLYVSALTCSDVDKLQRKHKDFLTNLTVNAMVDLIIQKAESKDGEKLFTLEDKPFLMREPVALVTRVASEMFITVTSVEDAEKN